MTPMKGGYVNIRIPGSSKILTLCQVEVYAEGNYSFYRYTNIGERLRVYLGFN